ncbi:MAG TPA: glycoside hydrolase family 76 protein [Bryobacteraceae bacterium]|jgi:predicted alpha-1,6-mannanase (GH76 family)|nr:glycoside hydrolase family 76 protein [Bryobacteraceae bacterium]
MTRFVMVPCAAVALALFFSPALSASQATRADAGMAALQNFYNTSTGLFNTPAGWWQDANALETTIDFSVRRNTSLYASDIATTFNNNNSQNFLNNYYDDEGWWAITWIKAYDFTGNTQYLNAAKTIFADMAGGWDSTTCNGGIWWSKDKTYKNAIANELFLTIAARLHNRTPGDGGLGSYLDWAQREWAWFSASGMINSSNLINDGLTSACQNNGQTTWSYNQGVILGGLTDLYKATGDTSLLTEAQTLASASMTSPALVNANGILVEPCEATGCGNDGVEFKGPYVRNLYYLYTADQDSAKHNFLLTNANSIWANDRDANDQFGLHWAGPFDTPDGARQNTALDAINGVIGATSYTPVNAPGTSTFAIVAQTTGTYKLTFHFTTSSSSATRTVLVNSVPVATDFAFSGTTATLAVSLVAGQNQIEVARIADNGNRNALQLASMDAIPAGQSFALFEAEDAASNVGVESTNPGYTGSGYRCCWASNGQYVTFSIEVKHPGAVQLIFHYAAAAGNASREIFVNGIPVNANLAFPNTSSWSNWSFVSLNANLQQGINSVTVIYDSSAGSTNFLNLDNVQVLY